MNGVLRGIFKRCLKQPGLTLPMLTLATVLAAPLASLAANGHHVKDSTHKVSTKSSSSRTVVVSDKESPGHTRKEGKKTLHKTSVVKAKGGKSTQNRLKKAIKRLAGGHRVAPTKVKTAHGKTVQQASLPSVHPDGGNREEGGLFSQLRAMEDPVNRKRLAKIDPMFKRPPTPSSSYREIIADQAATFGMHPLLIQAVVAVESGFNPRAHSSQGAMGMMQLTKATANRLGVAHPLDAEDNIRGGTLYLKMLTDQFDGDTTLALAAYQAGAKTVEEYGDVPPIASTHLFLKRVMLYFNYYLDQE